MSDPPYRRSIPENKEVILSPILSDEKLRERLHDGVVQFSRRKTGDAGQWNSFAGHFSHLSGDFKDAQTYSALKQQIEAKVDVLHAIRPIPHESVHEFAVRGQYGDGWIEGQRVCAYREEPDVAKQSSTPTFAALKLFVDNWRWQDVPFYLRTGKRLTQQGSEISIHFRPVPHRLIGRRSARQRTGHPAPHHRCLAKRTCVESAVRRSTDLVL